MDLELQKLLEQLDSLEKEMQQPQQQPQQQQQETTQTVDNSIEEQFKAWKDIGIMRFTSKYQHLPKFSQILYMVIPRADRQVLADIQAGKVRDEYLDYLEEAYTQVIKEVASFSKELLSSQQNQFNRQQPEQQKPQTPSYTMSDYYNDYKKYLEDITVKDVAIIEFQDGIVDNGKVRVTGIPRASLYEKIKELN